MGLRDGADQAISGTARASAEIVDAAVVTVGALGALGISAPAPGSPLLDDAGPGYAHELRLSPEELAADFLRPDPFDQAEQVLERDHEQLRDSIEDATDAWLANDAVVSGPPDALYTLPDSEVVDVPMLPSTRCSSASTHCPTRLSPTSLRPPTWDRRPTWGPHPGG